MGIELKRVETAAENILDFLHYRKIDNVEDLSRYEGGIAVGDEAMGDYVEIKRMKRNLLTLDYVAQGIYSRRGLAIPLKIDLREGKREYSRFVVRTFNKVVGYEQKNVNLLIDDMIWTKIIDGVSFDRLRKELETLSGLTQGPPFIIKVA